MSSMTPKSGHIGEPPSKPTYEYMVIDEVAYKIHKTVVHSFMMGDVDEPDIYAGQSLYDWQNSTNGKWVLEHAVETPSWHRHVDNLGWGYRYDIVAKFKEPDMIVWLLMK